MGTTLSGGCICKAVRYEVSAEPVMSVNCYCRDCQYATGGSAAPVMVVPKSGFKITRGELKQYEVTAESGNKVSRGFCPNCGSPILSLLSGFPDLVAVKAGSLDDPAQFKPTMNVWASSAPGWAPLARDLATFDKMPG